MPKNLSPPHFNASGEGRKESNKHDYKKNLKYLTQTLKLPAQRD